MSIQGWLCLGWSCCLSAGVAIAADPSLAAMVLIGLGIGGLPMTLLIAIEQRR